MFRFVKVLAVVLAISALIVPIASASACTDLHDAGCVTDCSCVCHAVSFPNYRESATNVIAPIVLGAVGFEPCCLGILLAADIFRPPTFA
jgi:hypothetical protein